MAIQAICKIGMGSASFFPIPLSIIFARGGVAQTAQPGSGFGARFAGGEPLVRPPIARTQTPHDQDTTQTEAEVRLSVSCEPIAF
jgi:hypothetical protein